MRKSSLSVVLLVTALSSAACVCRAGIIRHDRPPERYKELGEKEAFQCVGEVRPTEKSGIKSSAAAVLIAPRWALTAGHVGAGIPIEDQRYLFGGREYRPVRRVLHPDFKASDEPKEQLAMTASGADLALVELAEPVRNVKPAARYRGDKEVGTVLTKIGYGIAGNGKDGPSRPFQQERRGGNNMIDSAGGKFGELIVSDRVLLFDFDHPTDPDYNRLGKAAALDLEIGASPGDSGSGWFIQDAGTWKLVAITSGEIPPMGDPLKSSPLYGGIHAGMRVSKANRWIDEAMKADR